MGETFYQNNSLVTHILFELQSIIIFSPVANFGDQSLDKKKTLIQLINQGTWLHFKTSRTWMLAKI